MISRIYSSLRIQKQSGLSMIEVLVTLVIGMVLILGLVSIFSSNKNTQVLQAELAEMDSNARAALHVLRQSISHAGYPSANYVVMNKPFMTTDDAATFINPVCLDDEELIRGGSPLLNTNFLNSHSTDGLRDIITPIFMIDNPITRDTYRGCVGLTDAMARDCSTDSLPDPTQARNINRFYISLTDGRRALLCAALSGPSQPIAENIENMQVLYGVDIGNTINYMNADQIYTLEADGNQTWNNITSVQIALLVRSENEILPESESRTFTLLDEKITTPNDKRLYKVYSTTINLENRIFRTLE